MSNPIETNRIYSPVAQETFLKTEISNLEESNLGFILIPKQKYNHALGIKIKKVPSEKHYDPKQVNFKIIDDNDNIKSLSLNYNNLESRYLQLPTGSIRLEDQKGNKPKLFYSFGSKALVKPESSDITKIIIMSSQNTPILDYEDPLQSIIANTCEAILAKKRAEFLGNKNEYDSWLIQQEPQNLYYDSLVKLMRYLKLFHSGKNNKAIQYIKQEIERIENQINV